MLCHLCFQCIFLYNKECNESLLCRVQLGRAHEQIIQPLERFRKDHIGAVKVTIAASRYHNGRTGNGQGFTKDVALLTGG